MGFALRHAVAGDDLDPASPVQIILPATEIPVTVICTVSPDVAGSPVPTGSVTVNSNGTALGSVALSPDGRGNSVGSVTGNFTAGSYSISTDYSGDSNYEASSGIATASLSVT